MKLISRTLLAVGALAVAGCTNLPGANLGGTFSAESYLGQEIGGSDFNSHLAREYQGLAAFNANREVNWMDATAYIGKSKAAAAGGVAPFDPAELGVGGDAGADYSNAVAIITANAATRPAECASAQALWDQYLEALYQAPGGCLIADEVKAKFDAALAACAGSAGPSDYIVYFGFDRSNLNAAAEGVISEVVAALQGVAEPIVSMVGHTDTSGSAAYNQTLSERRVTTVANALAGAGIPTGGFSLGARGETETAVATGDGVREPRNRRVTIAISE